MLFIDLTLYASLLMRGQLLLIDLTPYASSFMRGQLLPHHILGLTGPPIFFSKVQTLVIIIE